MASFSFTWAGLDELIGALEGNADRIPAQASAVARKSGLDIEARAKQTVPVDTGATKNSIGMDVDEVNGESVEVTVGPQTWYAPLLEAGTERMPPRPFMGSAFDAVEPGFVAAIAAIANPLAGP
jgi:HK97 gp10 family phage protein